MHGQEYRTGKKVRACVKESNRQGDFWPSDGELSLRVSSSAETALSSGLRTPVSHAGLSVFPSMAPAGMLMVTCLKPLMASVMAS